MTLLLQHWAAWAAFSIANLNLLTMAWKYMHDKPVTFTYGRTGIINAAAWIILEGTFYSLWAWWK